jgi:hypothetical protein
MKRDTTTKQWGDLAGKQKVAVILAGIFGIFVFLGIVGAAQSPPTTTQGKPAAAAPPPAPAAANAKFEATAESRGVLDPKTRVVMVTVRNTSTVAGSPRCFVRATSLSGNYKGYDYFTGDEVPVLKSIEPGAETTFSPGSPSPTRARNTPPKQQPSAHSLTVSPAKGVALTAGFAALVVIVGDLLGAGKLSSARQADPTFTRQQASQAAAITPPAPAPAAVQRPLAELVEAPSPNQNFESVNRGARS